MTVDRRGKLAERPFRYEASRGAVRISWRGRVVKTLAGDAAAQFLRDAAALDDDAVQLRLAKLTGNFKRGNERARRRGG